MERKLCDCGCGDYPTRPDAKYIRGHDPLQRHTGGTPPPTHERNVARFEKKYIRKGPDECWPMKKVDKKRGGYGTFSVNGKMIGAHVYALMLKLGRPLKKGMCACHTCDNPRCVNPNHLWEGTIQEDHKDRDAKGRTAKGSKLTRPVIKRLRYLYQKNPKKFNYARLKRIAKKKYGIVIGIRAIENAVEYRSWKNVA